MFQQVSSAVSRLSRAARLRPSTALGACFSTQGYHGEAAALCCLRDSRAVLKLKGPDTFAFLQGMLSNDVRVMAKADAPGIMYSLMLNSQGRFVHDIFLHKQPGEVPDSIILDVDREHMARLTKVLQMYKLRSKVDILDVSDTHEVWSCLPEAGSDSSAAAPGPEWNVDPRLPNLGARAILPAGQVPPSKVVMPGAFRDLRFRLGVPEGCTEIPAGEALPLEYNLDTLNGVSYTKGCYIGQELTARTHFRGVIRKRLMPVLLEPMPPNPALSEPLTAGTPVLAEGAKRPAGKVTAVGAAGNAGIGVLRLDKAVAAMEGKLELVAAGRRVIPQVPSWWAKEWIEEARGATDNDNDSSEGD